MSKRSVRLGIGQSVETNNISSIPKYPFYWWFTGNKRRSSNTIQIYRQANGKNTNVRHTMRSGNNVLSTELPLYATISNQCKKVVIFLQRVNKKYFCGIKPSSNRLGTSLVAALLTHYAGCRVFVVVELSGKLLPAPSDKYYFISRYTAARDSYTACTPHPL